MYVSTQRINAGTLFVQPGDGFDPGDHPGPEPYYCAAGRVCSSETPTRPTVIDIEAGDAANIPALAQHWARNIGNDAGGDHLVGSRRDAHGGVEGEDPQGRGASGTSASR